MASEFVSIIATIITIYQACTVPVEDGRTFGVNLWAYPSLPVALVGLSLLFGERFLGRSENGRFWLLVITTSVLILVGLAIGLVIWRFDKSSGGGTWFMSVIFYAILALPLTLSRHFAILMLLGLWFVRVGGVSLAALNHYGGGQPYCKLQGMGFAVVYMTMGAIAAILGVFGAQRYFFRQGL